ncbi:MAG TPA: hypothetical protein VNI02_23315 [Blastocatellia bacterium]|jgi:hypothetical protein|nr:hypothetical protein [Blastocatellia bacterium]
MKTQRLAIVLTVINLVILIFNLAPLRQAMAEDIAPVLRGRSLEIVDDHGRVRASIKVHPADKTFKMPNGKIGYPETVMFRLIDPNGRPEVKIGASEQGGGLGLIGDSDSTYIVLEADGPDSSLKLTNKGGRQQLIKP